MGTAVSEAQTIKIACVGNSITYGDGIINRDKMSYPSILQAWMGAGYTIRNFGVNSTTMLRKGNKPYWDQPEYQEALNFNPDIIILELGTNDSKPENWVYYSGEFEKDYTDMVLSFKALASQPRMILVLPPPEFAEAYYVNDSTVRNAIIPIIKNISFATGCEYFDLYNPMLPYRWAFFPDGRHPTSIGTSIMAELYYRYFH